jgi:hypothetical protein
MDKKYSVHYELGVFTERIGEAINEIVFGAHRDNNKLIKYGIKTGVIYRLEDCGEYLQNVDMCTLGSHACAPFYAWTKNYVISVHENEEYGSLFFTTAPRDPTVSPEPEYDSNYYDG